MVSVLHKEGIVINNGTLDNIALSNGKLCLCMLNYLSSAQRVDEKFVKKLIGVLPSSLIGERYHKHCMPQLHDIFSLVDSQVKNIYYRCHRSLKWRVKNKKFIERYKEYKAEDYSE